MNNKIYEELKQKLRENYQHPDYEKEEIYEVKALACGKCQIGPYTQFACYAFASNS